MLLQVSHYCYRAFYRNHLIRFIVIVSFNGKASIRAIFAIEYFYWNSNGKKLIGTISLPRLMDYHKKKRRIFKKHYININLINVLLKGIVQKSICQLLYRFLSRKIGTDAHLHRQHTCPNIAGINSGPTKQIKV